MEILKQNGIALRLYNQNRTIQQFSEKQKQTKTIETYLFSAEKWSFSVTLLGGG